MTISAFHFLSQFDTFMHFCLNVYELFTVKKKSALLTCNGPLNRCFDGLLDSVKAMESK